MHGLYIFLKFINLSVKKYWEKSYVFSFLQVLEGYCFEVTVPLPLPSSSVFFFSVGVL